MRSVDSVFVRRPASDRRGASAVRTSSDLLQGSSIPGKTLTDTLRPSRVSRARYSSWLPAAPQRFPDLMLPNPASWVSANCVSNYMPKFAASISQPQNFVNVFFEWNSSLATKPKPSRKTTSSSAATLLADSCRPFGQRISCPRAARTLRKVERWVVANGPFGWALASAVRLRDTSESRA